MRRKEMELFIHDIIAKVEVVEYVNDAEEGNVYIDRFARQFLKEYCALVTKDKVKDLLKFMKTLV